MSNKFCYNTPYSDVIDNELFRIFMKISTQFFACCYCVNTQLRQWQIKVIFTDPSWIEKDCRDLSFEYYLV